jgi:tetrahydromethanopterin S-methyltransferase subunit G
MSDGSNLDAPVEQAISDKIAAKFGFPGEAEEAAPEAVAEAPVDDGLDEIEWEGAKWKGPKGIKDALMRNSDYTTKTQALSEQMRAIEHSRELMTQSQMDGAFRQSIDGETRELAVIEAYLQEAKKTNWGNMPMDQMVRARHELDQIKERRDDLNKAIEGKRAKFNEDFKSKLSELRTKSRELAAKSIPGFSEETEKAIRSYAMTEGLSESEVDNVLLDPRSAKVLWKASQFDKIKAGTTKAVDAVGKVVKPGAANEKMPQNVVDKLNFRKAMNKAETSGQKAQLIEKRLAGMFGE